MKKYLLFISILILVSCKKSENIEKNNTRNVVSQEESSTINNAVSDENADIEDKQNIGVPKESRIIKSKFDTKLLFGIWTNDPEGPHADFDLSKKSFYVVDYDGDGDMPYLINEDSIKVYYNNFISIGIIQNVTKDTLKIDWDKNGITVYSRWKG
ncbi:hypothetical protein OA93_19615 [Flavobacterium sp. KMS]|uniref:hypothetical protein n=1 Tax=Flavobacterium sp. KMS TaxID=1566023 RepID=UPI00057CC709|nr:hypothetical protein [Flavobacterium sp. KMS]KIA94696.1 hypothetical protein OA93_19615 [Flavobacterium sp. KMS]